MKTGNLAVFNGQAGCFAEAWERPPQGCPSQNRPAASGPACDSAAAWERPQGRPDKQARAWLCGAAAAGLLLLMPPADAADDDVNKGISFLTLSVGIQHDYKLPEDYKGQKLKFEGTYKRLSGMSHRKKENALRFVPKKQGFGALIIKSAKGEILQKLNIDVRKINLRKIAKEVSDLLIAVDGINIKILNGKVVIDGQIMLPKDMDRIAAVMAQYGNQQVVSLVTFSPEAQNKIAELILKKIENPDISLDVIYSQFILRGEVEDEAEKGRAERIARLYTRIDLEGSGSGPGKVMRRGRQKVVNLITVRPPPPPPKKKPPAEKKLIQIVVHYVELHKSFNKGFAFQWSPLINDGTTVNVSGGGVSQLPFALTATVKNLLPKLNWAKSFNFARILHNASLILKDGEKGIINVSTTVPVSQQTASGEISTSAPRETLMADMTPKITGPMKDHVNIKVGFRATNITGRSSEGVLTTERTLQTNLRVRGGVSAVLGGLISSNMRKNFNRLPPGSGDAPPLFTLLSSKTYETSTSQFVVFITPSITRSASSGIERIKKKFKLDES